MDQILKGAESLDLIDSQEGRRLFDDVTRASLNATAADLDAYDASSDED